MVKVGSLPILGSGRNTETSRAVARTSAASDFSSLLPEVCLPASDPGPGCEIDVGGEVSEFRVDRR